MDGYQISFQGPCSGWPTVCYFDGEWNSPGTLTCQAIEPQDTDLEAFGEEKCREYQAEVDEMIKRGGINRRYRSGIDADLALKRYGVHSSDLFGFGYDDDGHRRPEAYGLGL